MMMSGELSEQISTIIPENYYAHSNNNQRNDKQANLQKKSFGVEYMWVMV